MQYCGKDHDVSVAILQCTIFNIAKPYVQNYGRFIINNNIT